MDKPRRKYFPCALVESVQFRAEFANFYSCFYKSGNHGLTKYSQQVFNYVATWLHFGCGIPEV